MMSTGEIEGGKTWARRSINLRLFTVGFLSFMLLIPSAFVGSLIEEREQRRQEAIHEVGDRWGSEQTICGPVMHVPYRKLWKDEKGETRSTLELATILPASLDMEGSAVTEVRRRGIYEVVLYRTALRLSGHFGPLTVEGSEVSPEDVFWDRAFVTAGVSDMRGVEERVALEWEGQRHDFQPGVAGSTVLTSGLHCRVDVRPGGGEHRFAYDLTVRGHDGLHFVPVAGRTTVNLKSPWAHPSFTGAFLPHKHEISASGVTASWKVLDLNRGFPQQWLGSAASIQGFDFGLKFLYPVDSYQKSDRAHKYALLFIAMAFVSLFFVEILRHERVHTLNYILIGLAICLFYVLLLSVSEHLGFDLAYAIATLATTFLITWHSGNIFVQRRLSRFVGGVLVLLYGFMYILLQLQDFALLVGTMGLFVILAAVMAAASRITREEAA